MKKGWLAVLGGSFGITLLAFLFIQSRPYPSEQVSIIIRNIGHELLLQSGDSHTSILPVKQVGDFQYELSFKKDFQLNHDLLASVVQKNFGGREGFEDYTVEVIECASSESVYGFSIVGHADDVIPCRGRDAQSGCYKIRFHFTPPSDYSRAFSGIVSILVLALIVPALVLFTKASRAKRLSQNPDKPLKDIGTSIGHLIFNAEVGTLSSNTASVNLSDKELKVFKILTDNIGQLVTRDFLLHAVWESEGVITGRSLDVFISKLRKKISIDPSLSIVNVHGKGYKLVLEEPSASQ